MSFGRDAFRPPTVLTIAGSDSGGAAGLQADLKTLAALGVYGMSAITVVTAQNSESVAAVQPLTPGLVANQIDAVLSDYGADAAKTGFIGRVDLINTIAERLQHAELKHVVVDPVLVDHRGRAMFGHDVTKEYLNQLLPLADLVTPNRYEAALLSNTPLPNTVSLHWLRSAAEQLAALGARRVLLKGGRLEMESVDLYFDGTNHMLLASAWIETRNTHGSGDTLSAAVCAFLAKGYDFKSSVRRAHGFTYDAIGRAATWRLGNGHGPLDQTNISLSQFPFDSLAEI